jgi:hypothetical protein
MTPVIYTQYTQIVPGAITDAKLNKFLYICALILIILA